MAERLQRSTVKLSASLPDGNLANLDEIPGLLHPKTPPDAYGLFYAARKKLEHNDDQDGAETAVMRMRALEVVPDGKFPFDVQAGESIRDVLERIRTDRTGEAQIPEPTTAEQEKLDRLRDRLTVYRDEQLGGSTRKLGTQWKDYFGKDVGGWREGSAQQINEFLQSKAEQPDQPDPDQGNGLPLPGDEPVDVGSDMVTEQVNVADAVYSEIAERGKLPAAPCPDWSAGLDHGPHGWLSPVDGQVFCPGLDPEEATPAIIDGEVAAHTDGSARPLRSVPAASFSGGDS